jgi:putative Holliday junction resolvase
MLGVDLGTRRIGLACSDRSGTIASPLRVLERSGDVATDHQAIVTVAREEGAERIVVGLPRSLSGRDGPAARAVQSEVEQLRETAGDTLPVVVHDERFSTVAAEQSLVAAGVRRAGRRRVRDAAAAAVILQSYLEASR